jgi:multiple RNA-binding domain-containing protein 1
MSRLIIRNLPKHLTVKRLKEHFERQGEVTDARIMKTRDGRSRQFGFVGFKTAAAANQARAHFNGTYIDTSRVQVEVALKGGDSSLARPWSKHAPEVSKRMPAGRGRTLRDLAQGGRRGNQADPDAAARRRRQTAVSIDMDKNSDTAKLLQLVNSDDPKFKDFVEAHAPRAQGPVWGDGQRVNAKKKRRATVRVAGVQSKKAGGDKAPLLQKTHVTFGDESSDDELYEDAPSAPAAAARGQTGGVDDDQVPDISKPAFDAGLDDLAWLRSKVVSTTPSDDDAALSGGDSDGNSDTISDDTDASKGAAATPAIASATGSSGAEGSSNKKRGFVPRNDGLTDTAAQSSGTNAHLFVGRRGEVEAAADVGGTGRLFVRNLPYTATEEELEAFFQAWGQLSEVHVVRVRDTKASKGLAYIQYILPQHAVRALDQADGSIFQGRLLHVLPAASKEIVTDQRVDGHKGEGGSYKNTREQEQRQDAEKDHNWNSLFLSSNAVADSMAARLAVDKADVLGRDATGSSAVRLALGETQALSETRQLLEDEGIASSQGGGGNSNARSKTAMLVKNIPFSTTEAELIQLFEENGGPTSRVVLPASKTLALVECVEPADAKRAFRKLAYKKFKGTPLFLEWAPLAAQEAARRAVPDVGGDAAAWPEAQEEGSSSSVSDVVPLHEGTLKETANGGTLGDEDDAHQASGIMDGGMDERTLFVKNVNFKTSEEVLKQVFEAVMGRGSVRSCTLPKKTAKLRGKPNVKLPTVRSAQTQI